MPDSPHSTSHQSPNLGAPDNGLNMASIWERIADHQGDALALQHGVDGPSQPWSAFEERAARVAGALHNAGIGAGDNVALALYNGNEYLEAQFAAFKVRAAPCNVNYRYVEAELSYLVNNSDAKAVFFDASLVERFDHIHDTAATASVRLWIQVGDGVCPPWAVSFEDVIASAEPAPRVTRDSHDLWILYTGGTTGNPKGVMWPHANLATITKRNLDGWGVPMPESLDDIPAMIDAIARAGVVPRQLAASPLMHGTAGIGALMYLFCGGAVLTLESRSLDPAELWRVAETHRATTVSIVGDVFCAPMVDELDDRANAGDPVDLSSVLTVTSSGVMWSQPVKDRLLAHAKSQGAPLVCNDSLGSSEGVGFASKQSAAGAGTDTQTATFTLGPNAAVFTEDGRRVQPGSGEKGLLAVGGPIPLGYYGDPVKSAETFKEIDGKRWSIPGDWAEVAADATITLLGRGSVSINTGGEKVYPEEVEEALKLLDDVVDANVVGVPDPKWGAAVTAVVELRENSTITDTDLVDSLRTSLSGYKLPKQIVRVDKLFRSPNGKADYKWATQAALDALAE